MTTINGFGQAAAYVGQVVVQSVSAVGTTSVSLSGVTPGNLLVVAQALRGFATLPSLSGAVDTWVDMLHGVSTYGHRDNLEEGQIPIGVSAGIATSSNPTINISGASGAGRVNFVTVWEIAGAPPYWQNSPVVYAIDQGFATTLDIGSLGSPNRKVAVGMWINGADLSGQTVTPDVWIRDLYANRDITASSNSIGGGGGWPYFWSGHTTGTGAALEAQITLDSSHRWAGIGLLIDENSSRAYGQAQAQILGTGREQFGQAQSDIKSTVNKFAQAQAFLGRLVFGNASAIISRPDDDLVRFPINATPSYSAVSQFSGSFPIGAVADGNDNTDWAANGNSPAPWWQVTWSQAQLVGYVTLRNRTGGSFVDSMGTSRLEFSDGSTVALGFLSAGLVVSISFTPRATTSLRIQSLSGSAFNPGLFYLKAYSVLINKGYGQAQALIIGKVFGQAQAKINSFDYPQFGQANADIIFKTNKHAQAAGYIQRFPYGFGQAQAYILSAAYGQAQAWVCWRDTFTRTTAYGLGSDYTWSENDTNFDVASDSTYHVNGTKLVNSPDGFDSDSYLINRAVPTRGTVQFDFTTNSTFGNNGSWIVVLFGTGYTTGSLNFGISSYNNGWALIGDWNANLIPDLFVNGIVSNKTYTVKMAYNDTGHVAKKIWETGTTEPDWQMVGVFSPFNIETVSWLDLGFNQDIVSMDNLQFCIEESFPLYRTSSPAQAAAQITTTTPNAQAAAQITTTTPNATARAIVDHQIVSLDFFDNFNRTTSRALGPNYESTNSFESLLHIDGSKVVVAPGANDTYRIYTTAFGTNVHLEFDVVINNTGLSINPLFKISLAGSDSLDFFVYYNTTQLIAQVNKNGSIQTNTGANVVAGTTYTFKLNWNTSSIFLAAYDTGIQVSSASAGVGIDIRGATYADLIFLGPSSGASPTIDNLFIGTGNSRSGQAKAKIKATSNKFAQAQAKIRQVGQGCAQAQAFIRTGSFSSGNAQAYILPVKFGQAQADILATTNTFAQAQAYILRTDQGYGQAQARIFRSIVANAQALIVRNIYQRMIVAYGPIDYWPLDETSGLIAHDFFARFDGTNSNATINQAGIAGALGGRSYLFDGSSSRIYTDTSRDISETAYTLEAWIRTSTSQSDRGIIGRWNTTGAYLSYTSPTQIQLIHGSNSADYATATVGSGLLADNNWHHIVGTYDGTYTRIYVDSTLADIRIATGPQGTPVGIPFEIGTYNSRAASTFAGNIDEAAYYNYALNDIDVLVHYRTGLSTQGFAQAQAKIFAFNYPRHAQAAADIFATSNHFAQAQGDIRTTYQGYAQAQAKIVHNGFGQAQAKINAYDFPRCGNAQGSILAIQYRFAQSQALIKTTAQGYGQAQARIVRNGFGQAQAKINSFNYPRCGNAQGYITRPTFTYQTYGQANALIRPKNKSFANAQADIKRIITVSAQAAAYIGHYSSGNAKAYIIHRANVYAQAQALLNQRQTYGQAQAQLQAFDICKSGNARSRILVLDNTSCGQAQATLAIRTWVGGQAAADISHDYWSLGMAMAVISRNFNMGLAVALIVPNNNTWVFAQAQADIVGYYLGSGQAKASIVRTIKHANAQALISQQTAGKLVKYGKYFLPGYLNTAAVGSPLEITIDGITYKENSLEVNGLQNKTLTLRLQVVDETYLAAKEQVQLASTMLRHARSYQTLTVMDTSKYYLAQTKSINLAQEAGTSERSAFYDVAFECRPWLYSQQVYSLTGTTTLDTNTVGRTLADGINTPATLRLSGTDVTVSGYTESGEFMGYISVQGTVNNLVVDSEIYAATINDISVEDLLNTEYQVFVGVGRTLFDVTGATDCEITYRNRWAL
jgi:hypothetical protein